VLQALQRRTERRCDRGGHGRKIRRRVR
jgi:hypothetical protein